jgi:hypothetical protein
MKHQDPSPDLLKKVVNPEFENQPRRKAVKKKKDLGK